MSLASDFRSFALRGNVIDLAVAVVIGAAFSKIVTAIVEGLIMPIVGVLTPAGNWRQIQATPLGLRIGEVLGATVDFLIIAAVLFLIVRKVARWVPAPPPAAVVATKTCPDCLETIPRAAKKCRACGSAVAAA